MYPLGTTALTNLEATTITDFPTSNLHFYFIHILIGSDYFTEKII